ncbi:MAG: ATP-dependent DNA helicase RecG [Dermatophilus congolensis]|nr:ATP-dependent DNA helicase RecG [Dermatophilus congolensis]
MADWWTPLRSVLPDPWPKKLREGRDITTVGELLRFRPSRFLDPNGNLDRLNKGDYVVFFGTVIRAETRTPRPKAGKRLRPMLNALVRSGDHTLALTFFNAWGHEREFEVGRRGLFAGTVSTYRDQWQLAHPAYQFEPDEADDAGAPDDFGDVSAQLQRARVPVYREVKGMPSWKISIAVEEVLKKVDLGDPVPRELTRARGLVDFTTAWRHMHLPENAAQFFAAFERLKYDEALVIQLALARRRLEQQDAPAVPRSARPGGLLEAFDAALPFTLTGGQRAVGEEIARDLARAHPMNRLLQGDVGSGKTVVALRAMLAVIDAGGQAALLAPTEVLAQQHHRSLLAMLGPLAEGGLLGGADQGTRVALLVGGDSTSRRKAALLQAASGEAGIVVGTHALLQEHVQFADLGLVVVDEQHRFGVEQRDALRDKAKHSPHMLVMTATPIPRTVAMTVFGDMDTSVLAELPAGRAPVQTAIVDNPRWYERAWQRVAEEVAGGRQVYIVCPRIGDESDPVSAGGAASAAGESGADGFEAASDVWSGDDDVFDAPGGADSTRVRQRRGRMSPSGEWIDEDELPLEDRGPDPSARPQMRGVIEAHAELAANPVLAGVRLGLLHGRMSGDEKDATMTAFAQGRIDVLVSTTVIEVGVDVPNATVMVVLDADRFGISQLHQLRGRVGRGGLPGLCLLVTREPTSAGRDRLEAVAATTDGFELSRLDLASRREGDILGSRQSGAGSRLQMLRLTGRDDERIIAEAREDASRIVAADPDLRDYVDLARMLEDRLDETQVDFLQKG